MWRGVDDLRDSVHSPIGSGACGWCGATGFHTMEDTRVDEARRRSCDIKYLPLLMDLPYEKATGSSLEEQWWNSLLSDSQVRELLDKGASPHVSRGGRSLLCHCLAMSHTRDTVNIVSILLARGARFDRCDIDLTPLPHASFLARPAGCPPLPPFYQASLLVQWEAYSSHKRPPLRHCIESGILDGSDNESLVLPAYFEWLFSQFPLVSDILPRDVAEIADTIALLLHYTCATIDTQVYPPPRWESRTDPTLLSGCLLQVGETVYMRVSRTRPTLRTQNNSTPPSPVFPTNTDEYICTSVVTDRGIGFRGQVCVRLYNRTQGSHWVNADSAFISHSLVVPQFSSKTLYQYLHQHRDGNAILASIREKLDVYTRSLVPLFESYTTLLPDLVHIVCHYLCTPPVSFE